MNIFEENLNKINALIFKNQKFLALKSLNNFKGIAIETPPPDFNFDLSCNASLVLGKINKINPKELAAKIKELIIKGIVNQSNSQSDNDIIEIIKNQMKNYNFVISGVEKKEIIEECLMEMKSILERKSNL